MEIERQDFTGFVDYDRNKLNKLTYFGQIEYFAFRVKKVFLAPLEQILNKVQMHISDEECSYTIVFGVLICSGIDAFSGFLCGKQPGRPDFCCFCQKYLNKKWIKKRPAKYCPEKQQYMVLLRDNFRNGLSHGFAVKEGGFESHRRNLPYINETAHGVQVNPIKLFNDFNNAINKYLDDLRKDGETSDHGKKFIKRFGDVFIKGK
jgi:hypothetical protein